MTVQATVKNTGGTYLLDGARFIGLVQRFRAVHAKSCETCLTVPPGDGPHAELNLCPDGQRIFTELLAETTEKPRWACTRCHTTNGADDRDCVSCGLRRLPEPEVGLTDIGRHPMEEGARRALGLDGPTAFDRLSGGPRLDIRLGADGWRVTSSTLRVTGIGYGWVVEDPENAEWDLTIRITARQDGWTSLLVALTQVDDAVELFTSLVPSEKAAETIAKGVRDLMRRARWTEQFAIVPVIEGSTPTRRDNFERDEEAR